MSIEELVQSAQIWFVDNNIKIPELVIKLWNS